MTLTVYIVLDSSTAVPVTSIVDSKIDSKVDMAYSYSTHDLTQFLDGFE